MKGKEMRGNTDAAAPTTAVNVQSVCVCVCGRRVKGVMTGEVQSKVVPASEARQDCEGDCETRDTEAAAVGKWSVRENSEKGGVRSRGR